MISFHVHIFKAYICLLTINKREIIAEGPTPSVYDLSAKRFKLMSDVCGQTIIHVYGIFY